MQVRIEQSTYDKRIFNVLIDVTGYIQYHPLLPIRTSYGQSFAHGRELKEVTLDKCLSALGLRRIEWWRPEYPASLYGKIVIYRTVVISDRI